MTIRYNIIIFIITSSHNFSTVRFRRYNVVVFIYTTRRTSFAFSFPRLYYYEKGYYINRFSLQCRLLAGTYTWFFSSIFTV